MEKQCFLPKVQITRVASPINVARFLPKSTSTCFFISIHLFFNVQIWLQGKIWQNLMKSSAPTLVLLNQILSTIYTSIYQSLDQHFVNKACCNIMSKMWEKYELLRHKQNETGHFYIYIKDHNCGKKIFKPVKMAL